MPRTIQRQGPNPKPTEIASSADAQEGEIKGLTKDSQEMMEAMLIYLDQLIQKETSNPRRRENIQICRDYVRQYDWPEDDYYIWVVQGVVKVITQEERFELPPSPAKADNFLLVRSSGPSSASSAETTKY